MDKKIGLFWLREDFRLSKNNGLIEATINHEEVVVFYLYKENNYQNQEAQKWWLSKSLLNFKKKLNGFNIGLEIIKTSGGGLGKNRTYDTYLFRVLLYY